jgi:predicted ATP-dependent endonuclease of OLD family
MEYSFIKELDDIQSKYFLLLFEEPEAHLHKHIQMALFEKTGLNANEGVQIIMTTHSDNISAASKISNLNVIKKNGKSSMVMQPYCGLEDNEITHIERYLDVKRSELLFSKSVILVEGDAEEILIPIMVKKCFGVSLDELGISLINIGSVGFENIYKLFHDQRIQKKCAVITDLDTPINVSDSSQQNAYERGKNRKIKIKAENNINEWVDGFFAPYTFEVELVKNNKTYIEELIDKTYTDLATIAQKKVDIKSEDVMKYGDVVLKLASYNKKGWNAILLSEIIDGKFQIPEYILDAIIFAGKDEILRKQNSFSILHHYAKIFEDVELLERLAHQEISSIEDYLKIAKETDCTAISFLKKSVVKISD